MDAAPATARLVAPWGLLTEGLDIRVEALVEAFKLCVHQVVDHALEDGQVAAAHVAAKEHSRRDGKLLAEAGDEGGGGKLGSRFYDGKMLLGDFKFFGELALGEPRHFAEFANILP